jgi:3-oxoacyl-[acyl-carrier-protein] synthase II
MKERLESLFSLGDSDKAGIILGLGSDTSYYPYFEDLMIKELKGHDSSGSDFGRYFNPYDIHAVYPAERLRLAAFQKTVLTACASSTQAISFAVNALRNDEAEIVLSGGTDSILNQLAYVSFDKLGALSHETDVVGETCKPFDAERSGTIAGEAAGLCVLATEDFVNRHGLQAKFEMLGYGNSLDAYKITAPDPSGKGIKLAVERALDMAGVSLDKIDYINLHGTGTELNDEAESRAFSELFESYSAQVRVSSTKDRHGHAIASAGIQELAVLCTAMEEAFIPAILNLKDPIQINRFNPIKGRNISAEINIGMTCNYAFGGINSAIIIKKCNHDDRSQ